MFNVGDKVVYPMYGAGVIESIEEKEILGEIRKYYVMRMPVGDMKVMIPIGNVQNIGLRDVVDECLINNVMDNMCTEEAEASINWNQRYRANMDKVKSGDIFKVAEVVRSLMLREIEKGLSTGERKMLENAKQILVSEFVLVKGIDEVEAMGIITELIEKNKNASV
ncbi:CarD family transcriptional regulator [Desulfuribacillus alkaliarsenatis]|uniref:CarD family transcriptional regulator n=1 Tax=Desulfuribacillus alkaliarsenatis TaxID=766136 RepID=A0A1E5G4K2_9FIRM|nr:CarD family transcriptional regulator [Desulfuribacillus alkaliarsenatis]OEF97964.1 CarD family transcriptional regulator [Desulfuribacillus alkaliarsenatis]